MLELRQRLVEAPDDIDSWRVFGDWLQQSGDPRGDLVQTQLALEAPDLDDSRRRSLQARERSLLDAHREEWLGPLAAPLAAERDQALGARYQFRRGHLHALDLVDVSDDVVAGLADFADRDLIGALSVDFLFRGDERTLDRLAELDFPSVRELRFGDGSGSIVEEGHAASIAARMPRLRSLSISGRRVEPRWLFELSLPELRRLSVSCAYRHAIPRLVGNPDLQGLESLALFPHALEPEDDDTDGYLPLSDVAAIARGLPRLRSLTLWQSTAGDAGVAALVDNGRLEGLSHLDLSYGEITDEGAERIAAAPGRLEHLVLRFNRLTAAGVERLHEVGIAEVVVEPQSTQEGRWYLYQGDIE